MVTFLKKTWVDRATAVQGVDPEVEATELNRLEAGIDDTLTDHNRHGRRFVKAGVISDADLVEPQDGDAGVDTNLNEFVYRSNGQWFKVFPTPFFNVKSFGAKGDGVTDDTAAIQAAINACGIAGGGIVFFPKGTYQVATGQVNQGCLYIRYDNVWLMGVGSASKLRLATGNTLIIAHGGLKPAFATNIVNKWYQRNTVFNVAPPVAGDMTLTLLNAADAANVAAGDVLYMRTGQTSSATQTTEPDAEQVEVLSVAGTTINLKNPLAKSYAREYFTAVGISTTVAVDVASGANTMTVADATGFLVNDAISITGEGLSGSVELNTLVTAIAGNVLTLDPGPVGGTIKAGAIVTRAKGPTTTTPNACPAVFGVANVTTTTLRNIRIADLATDVTNGVRTTFALSQIINARVERIDAVAQSTVVSAGDISSVWIKDIKAQAVTGHGGYSIGFGKGSKDINIVGLKAYGVDGSFGIVPSEGTVQFAIYGCTFAGKPTAGSQDPISVQTRSSGIIEDNHFLNANAHGIFIDSLSTRGGIIRNNRFEGKGYTSGTITNLAVGGGGWTFTSETLFNVRDFGAKGDGVTNDTTAIRNAINAAEVAGGGVVFFPGPAKYMLNTRTSNSLLWVNGSNITLRFQPGAVLKTTLGTTTYCEMLTIGPPLSSYTNIMTAIPVYNLTGSYAKGVMAMTLANPADVAAAGLVAGDWVLVRTGQTISGGVGNPDCELNQIDSVDGGTGIFTLRYPTAKPYVQEYFVSGTSGLTTPTVTANPALFGISKVTPYVIQNIKVIGAQFDALTNDGYWGIGGLGPIVGFEARDCIYEGRNKGLGSPGAGVRGKKLINNKARCTNATVTIYHYAVDVGCTDFWIEGNEGTSDAHISQIHIHEGAANGFVGGNILNSKNTAGDFNNISIRGRNYGTHIGHNVINGTGNTSAVYVDGTCNDGGTIDGVEVTSGTYNNVIDMNGANWKIGPNNRPDTPSRSLHKASPLWWNRYAPAPPRLVATIDPKLAPSSIAAVAGEIRAVRVIIPCKGTLRDLAVYVNTNTGGNGDFGIYDVGDAAAGSATRLWSTGSIVFPAAGAWRIVGDPQLSVEEGQQLDFYWGSDAITVAIAHANTLLTGAATQLPTNFWPALGGLQPKLAWSRAVYPGEAATTEANKLTSGRIPCIIARVA